MSNIKQQIINERINTYFENDAFIKIIEKCYDSNIGKKEDINAIFTETYIKTLYMHLNFYMNLNKKEIDINNLKEVIDNICVFVLIYSFLKGKYNNTGERSDYKLDIYKAIKKLLNQLNKDKFKELIVEFNKIKIDNEILGNIQNIDDSINFNNINNLVEYIKKTNKQQGGTGEGADKVANGATGTEEGEQGAQGIDAIKGNNAEEGEQGAQGTDAIKGNDAEGIANGVATGAVTDNTTTKEENDDDKTLLNVFKMKIMYEIFLFEENKINTLNDVIINEKY